MHGASRLNCLVLQRSEQMRKRMAKGMKWILEAKVRRCLRVSEEQGGGLRQNCRLHML